MRTQQRVALLQRCVRVGGYRHCAIPGCQPRAIPALRVARGHFPDGLQGFPGIAARGRHIVKHALGLEVIAAIQKKRSGRGPPALAVAP
jgi:hypothetical protein